jgi:heat shock protein 4
LLINFISASEREALVAELEVANEWLYEEGFDATAKEFNSKVSKLNETAAPIFVRHYEYTNRPVAISYLLQGFNYTRMFLAKAHNLSEVFSVIRS